MRLVLIFHDGSQPHQWHDIHHLPRDWEKRWPPNWGPNLDETGRFSTRSAQCAALEAKSCNIQCIQRDLETKKA